MACISVQREVLKPQDYASDGTDAIGFLQFWGNSPALDLIEDVHTCRFGPAAKGVSPGGYRPDAAKGPETAAEAEGANPIEGEGTTPEQETALTPGEEQGQQNNEEDVAVAPLSEDGAINFLIVGGADLRHVVKTVARQRSAGGPRRRLRFFLHERHHEVLARHVLFLQIANNTRLSARERMETFLSLYGNTLVRERDSLYASDIANEFVELVTDNSSHPLTGIVDLSHLKFKDRDVLQDVFKGWCKDVRFDIEALREQRCRGYYRDRYDFRKNMMDWDFTNNVKEVAGIIHWYHYKEFCHTGVAFETRLASYNTPNRTLASYTEAKDRKKGTTVQVRGFWGDIINSPYHAFGTTTDPEDHPRLFKISGQQYRQTETDVSEFNLTAFFSMMDTGLPFHLPPERPEEHVYPYASPLDEVLGADRLTEVQEDEHDTVGEGHEDGNGATPPLRGGRRPVKKAVDWPQLSPGFEDVDVVLLTGELGDVLRKPKYRGLFHRAFIGTMGLMPFFDEMGISKGSSDTEMDDPFAASAEAARIRKPPRLEAPGAFGLRRDASTLAGAMAAGACVVCETMKYQAHFDGLAKLSLRHRVAQAGHLAGWRLCNERRAVPRIEHDMKDSRARALEKDATDFLRFVVPAGAGSDS